MSRNGTAVAGDGFSSGNSDDSSVSDDTTWISWFCQLKGNEFFCEVDESFIKDDFNLTGLSSGVTYFNYALDTILDENIPEGELDERQQELIEVSAETLYGLIHARYILTAKGMQAMYAKFIDGQFGRCPRVYCVGQQVLPVGESDMPRCSTVRIFCPMCWDLYFPRSRNHYTLDGAYWGTTFPHLFLHSYPEAVPQRSKEKYVPRIFGFKIHPTSEQVKRNKGIQSSSASTGRERNNNKDQSTSSRRGRPTNSNNNTSNNNHNNNSNSNNTLAPNNQAKAASSNASRGAS